MRNIKDLAKATGHPQGYLSWAIGAGLVPPPDLQPQRRKFYSAEQFQKAVRAFAHKASEEFFTATALCRLIAVPKHRFDVWRRRSLLPEPIALQGKREVWDRNQVDEIRTLLPELRKLKSHRSAPDGYYNQTTAAQELGIPRITFQWKIAKGVIPRPTRIVKGWSWPFYSESDLRQIRKQQAGYFEKREK